MGFVNDDVAVGHELRFVELLGLGDRESLGFAKRSCSVIARVRVEVDAVEDVVRRLWGGAGPTAWSDEDARFVDKRGVGLRPGDLLE